VDRRWGARHLLARGGRIDSPTGSSELKKQVQMIVEGSVLYAEGNPLERCPMSHPKVSRGLLS
jgi:hypothetical protein